MYFFWSFLSIHKLLKKIEKNVKIKELFSNKKRIDENIRKTDAPMNNSLLVYNQTGILLPFHFGTGRLLTNLTTFFKTIVIMSRKCNCIISLS